MFIKPAYIRSKVDRILYWTWRKRELCAPGTCMYVWYSFFKIMQCTFCIKIEAESI
jgi:hypothetical protein